MITMGLFNKKVLLEAPASGVLKPVTAVPDDLFSTKAMGDGYAIEPTSDEVFAPVKGTVTSVFPTQHAIGFKTKKEEVLLHIGLDTVSLNGEGFHLTVKEGDTVTPETKIGTVDFDLIKQKGLASDVIVIITKTNKKLTLDVDGNVTAGQTVAHLE